MPWNEREKKNYWKFKRKSFQSCEHFRCSKNHNRKWSIKCGQLQRRRFNSERYLILLKFPFPLPRSKLILNLSLIQNGGYSFKHLDRTLCAFSSLLHIHLRPPPLPLPHSPFKNTCSLNEYFFFLDGRGTVKKILKITRPWQRPGNSLVPRKNYKREEKEEAKGKIRKTNPPRYLNKNCKWKWWHRKANRFQSFPPSSLSLSSPPLLFLHWIFFL